MRRQKVLMGCVMAVWTVGLVATGSARAHDAYQITPIAAVGGRAGEFPIPTGYSFYLGPLDDRGELLFDAGIASSDPNRPDLLLLYAQGKVTPVALPGQETATGRWPDDILTSVPLSMNQRGEIVFALGRVAGGSYPWIGTYRTESPSGPITSIVRAGMPASEALTVTEPGGFAPAINGRGDVALVAGVKSAGGSSGTGLLLLGRDGRFQPVLLPKQELPGGKHGKSHSYMQMDPSLNDAAAVAFLVSREGERQSSAYLWEAGSLVPLAIVGTPAPNGGTISAVSQVLLNNRNRTALLVIGVDGSRNHGLYRFADGRLQPVVVPGQEMPGGGRFQAIQNVYTSVSDGYRCLGVSAANELGEHGLVAELEDGETAAYRLDAESRLSLILKSGSATDAGPVTRVGSQHRNNATAPACSLNARGEVALIVQNRRGGTHRQ
jgi:hypothetical protein